MVYRTRTSGTSAPASSPATARCVVLLNRATTPLTPIDRAGRRGRCGCLEGYLGADFSFCESLSSSLCTLRKLFVVFTRGV